MPIKSGTGCDFLSWKFRSASKNLRNSFGANVEYHLFFYSYDNFYYFKCGKTGFGDALKVQSTWSINCAGLSVDFFFFIYI